MLRRKILLKITKIPSEKDFFAKENFRELIFVIQCPRKHCILRSKSLQAVSTFSVFFENHRVLRNIQHLS